MVRFRVCIDFHFDVKSDPHPDHLMPPRLAYSCQLPNAVPRWHLFEFAPLHLSILPHLLPLSHIDHQGHLFPPLAMALATFGGIGPVAGLGATSIRQAATTCRSSGATGADGSL